MPPIPRNISRNPATHRFMLHDNDWQLLQVKEIHPGMQTAFPDGLVHRKTVSATILCQPFQGEYHIATPRGEARIRTGELFLVGANQPLVITHFHRQGAMKARWVHANFTLFHHLDFTSYLDLPLRVSHRRAEALGEIIEAFLELRTRQAESGGHLIERIVYAQELATRLMRHLWELARPDPTRMAMLTRGERLIPLLQRVRDDLAAPWTVSQLAATIHLSPSRLHALLKQSLQQSPMGLVRELRIAEARQRVIHTDQTMAEIAEATGFQNPFHFSRCFKRIVGMAPLALRSQHQQDRFYSRNHILRADPQRSHMNAASTIPTTSRGLFVRTPA